MRPSGGQHDPSERLYGLLSGEDPADRACEAIPEQQCTSVPANYVRNVANGACTKLAEQLAGPNLVLPWLLAAAGVPAGVVGFLAPIRQAGALLPQLAVSAAIRGLPRRKWVWVAAGILQGLTLAAMIPAVLLLPPLAAGLTVLALLTAFSLASGTASVSFQDVIGKTIPKGRRGVLLGNRAMLGGALTVAAGAVLYLLLGEEAGAGSYALLVGLAALLWLAGAALFARIEELPGATGGGKNALEEARYGLRLVARVSPYRRYLLARGLLVTVEIAAPFYALFAKKAFGGALGGLGVYVLAVGAGNVVASRFWGKLSDLSARRTLILSGGLAAALALGAVTLGALPAAWRTPWLFGAVFVGLGIAQSGVRVGRKTYLVDAVPGEDRPVYVAFANTGIGIVTLGWGAIGLLSGVIGLAGLLLTLAGLAVAGGLAAAAMPEAAEFTAATAPDRGGLLPGP
jgi:hypothetical protein